MSAEKQKDSYAWWRAALAGKPGEIHENFPSPKFMAVTAKYVSIFSFF
jgi:hypothetical protein